MIKSQLFVAVKLATELWKHLRNFNFNNIYNVTTDSDTAGCLYVYAFNMPCLCLYIYPPLFSSRVLLFVKHAPVALKRQPLFARTCYTRLKGIQIIQLWIDCAKVILVFTECSFKYIQFKFPIYLLWKLSNSF